MKNILTQAMVVILALLTINPIEVPANGKKNVDFSVQYMNYLNNIKNTAGRDPELNLLLTTADQDRSKLDHTFDTATNERLNVRRKNVNEMMARPAPAVMFKQAPVVDLPRVDLQNTMQAELPRLRLEDVRSELPEVRVKGFEQNLPSVQVNPKKVNIPNVDVKQVHAQLPNIPIADIKQKIPEVNVKANIQHIPNINVQQFNANMPQIDIQMANQKMPDVQVKVVKQDMPEVNVHANQQKMPSIDVIALEQPLPDISVQVQQQDMPNVRVKKQNVDMPSVGVDIRDVNMPNVNIRKVDTQLPNINVTELENQKLPNVNIERMNKMMPDVNVAIMEQHMPKVNVNRNNIHMPRVDVDTENVNMPQINVDVKTVDMPSIDVHAQETELPNFNVMKINANMPRIGVRNKNMDMPTVNIEKVSPNMPSINVKKHFADIPNAFVPKGKYMDTPFVEFNQSVDRRIEPVVSDRIMVGDSHMVKTDHVSDIQQKDWVLSHKMVDNTPNMGYDAVRQANDTTDKQRYRARDLPEIRYIENKQQDLSKANFRSRDVFDENINFQAKYYQHDLNVKLAQAQQANIPKVNAPYVIEVPVSDVNLENLKMTPRHQNKFSKLDPEPTDADLIISKYFNAPGVKTDAIPVMHKVNEFLNTPRKSTLNVQLPSVREIRSPDIDFDNMFLNPILMNFQNGSFFGANDADMDYKKQGGFQRVYKTGHENDMPYSFADNSTRVFIGEQLG